MIQSISTYLPFQTLTNESLASQFPDWSSEKIFEKTGIRTRHIAGEKECASDLAVAAAEKLLGTTDRSKIDFLLFCTQSPDYLLPTTACLLQERLRLPTTIGALDFNLGCSGFVYGLSLAQSLLTAGQASHVLLLTADTYSKFIPSDERSTRTIFGDAGAATLLQWNSPNRLHAFVFGTDGSGAEQLILRDSGLRKSHSADPTPLVSSGAMKPALYMNGPEVFNFTIRVVPVLVDSVLAKARLSISDIDMFVFHQANAYMLGHLRKKLRIPGEKFMIDVENCGNTVSATIPIALEALLSSRRLRGPARLLLAGFGVGLSWAGCILEWNSNE